MVLIVWLSVFPARMVWGGGVEGATMEPMGKYDVVNSDNVPIPGCHSL